MKQFVDDISDLRVSRDSSARNLVQELYKACLPSNATYQRWCENFRLIHGELDTQRQADLEHLNGSWGVDISSKDDLFVFIFCLETYFSIILRMISYRAVTKKTIEVDQVLTILDGSYLSHYKILNFGPCIFDEWYVEYRAVLNELKGFISLFNKSSFQNVQGDFLKSIYENVFPRQIRHSMGEFYTPDWLASFVNETLLEGEKEIDEKTFLDPACGSGTFLIDLIHRYRERVNASIYRHVVGFDMNPISVMAAKTNIILAIQHDIAGLKSHYVIPIFQVDTINSRFGAIDAPGTDNNMKLGLDSGRIVIVPWVVIQYKEILDIFAGLLCEGGTSRNKKLNASQASLMEALRSQSLNAKELEELLGLYAQHTVRNVDFIVGNPPWVNWEYLPNTYRDKTVHLWQYYGLFDLRGRDATFIKEDISALLTYVVIDRHLKRSGNLGFVIKESLFKSSLHGEGFRKLFLKPEALSLNVYRVDDLIGIRPFEGINNRPVVMFLNKGEETKYPVRYHKWMLKAGKRLKASDDLAKAKSKIHSDVLSAKPVNDKLGSGWITFSRSKEGEVDRILGQTSYRARTGTFTGGANSIFWLRVEEGKIGNVQVSNINERAKIKSRQVTRWVEKEYVYPLLTGRELGMWQHRYSQYILMPHNRESRMYPVKHDALNKTPLTKQYLEIFSEDLKRRKGFAGWEKKILEEYYYALQRIGDYTFARYKVAWRYISSKFMASVISSVQDKFLGKKLLIPNEKIIYIGIEDKQEAFYLCGVLTSTQYRDTIESFMIGTQISPSVLQRLYIPTYDPHNENHANISRLCEEGHSRNSKGIMSALDGEITLMLRGKPKRTEMPSQLLLGSRV
jgi:SAM-dependent methyltransferase